MRFRGFLALGGSATLAAGVFFVGCGDDASSGGGGSGVDISDVVFDMEGGDEALEEVLRIPPVDDPAQAAVVDARTARR